MMRVLEPELMTSEAPVAAYAGADLTEINQGIVDSFQARFPGFRGSCLLDLGCGAADVSIRFAKAYAGIAVLGVDGSGRMLDEARRAVQRAGFEYRIRFAQHRLPDERLPRESFDAVVANSVLHHLEDPLSLWRTVLHCAKPGAAVMVVDLCRPRSVEEAEALVLRFAAEAAPLLREDFFHSLCAAYRADEVREQLKHSGLNGFQTALLGDLQLVAWGTTGETAACVR
ncbi:MAG TPA: class I SAM-dependent methyltransferase [Bryobacteraceae bacterium]